MMRGWRVRHRPKEEALKTADAGLREEKEIVESLSSATPVAKCLCGLG